MRNWKRLAGALLALVMLFGSLGIAEGGPKPAGAMTVHTGVGDLSFFADCEGTDWTIGSFGDASAAVRLMSDALWGAYEPAFIPWRTLSDPAGNAYYVFRQVSGDTTVSGGAVKVVAGPDGRLLGIVGSVETDVPEAPAGEEIDAAAAEEIVLARAEGDRLVEGATEETWLPVNYDIDMTVENEKEELRRVWTVYTGDGEGFQAHYVTAYGEVLYDLPVGAPGDEDALRGYAVSSVFEYMEPVDYTGPVTRSDGTQEEISLQLMRDTRTGITYLGNAERRIAVADCYPFLYEGGRLVLETEGEDGWDDTCLYALYNYCRAWDYFHEIGWTGSDGRGTPMLILKDFCDEDQQPVDNASYAGTYYGWELFLSSSVNDLAQCLDVVAHEFTHGVTNATETWNSYKNDAGAINEAMSDIQGNLCEMYFGATYDSDWEMGEMGSAPVRSMSNPHRHRQPEYTWDLYYQENVRDATDINDRGGVHSNSSLMNHIGYRLCEDGGMTLEEARGFWFTVDCALVPGTDFPQLELLLPWALKLSGLERFQPALGAAIAESGLDVRVMPGEVSANRGLVTLTLPDEAPFTDGTWALLIVSVDVDAIAERIRMIAGEEGDCAGALDELGAALGTGWQGELTAEEKLDAIRLQAMALLAAPEEELEGRETELMQQAEAVGDWLQKYLGDVVFMGMNGPGMDGQSVRMVTRPGWTLPVLLHIDLKANSQTPETVGLAVYTMGDWYDVIALFRENADMFAEASESEASMDDAELGGLLGTLLGEEGDSAEPDIEALAELLDGMDFLLDMIFTRIQPGRICVLPSTGLSGTSIATVEELNAMFEGLLPADEGADEGETGLEEAA